jgi:hypothetical protein
LTFTVFPSDDFEMKKRQVSNLLNGQQKKIIVDKDPEYYWIGRCSVNEYASNKNLHKIVVGVTVAPYKWKQNETVVPFHFCGKNLFDGTIANVAFATSSGVTRWHITTKDARYLGIWLPIQPGKTYTVTRSANVSNRFAVGFTEELPKENMPVYNRIDGDIGLSVTATAPDNCKFMVCYLTNQGDDVLATTYQIEIGDTATEYEPYAPTTDPREVILTCGRKSVCPTVICTGEVSLMYGDAEVMLNTGTHKIIDFRLHEGTNPVTVSGAGAVMFIYQEGDL